MREDSVLGADPIKSLHRRLPTSLYYQVEEWLINKIYQEELRLGDKLPSEPQLVAALGVSRSVVRQALLELERKGWIERRQGIGTFVAKQHYKEDLLRGVQGLADIATAKGETVESEVLQFEEVSASASIAEHLRVTQSEPILVLQRLRRRVAKPHVLTVSYLPSKLVPGLLEHDFNGVQSLYQVLRHDYNLVAAFAWRAVEARTANDEQANLLGINVGDAMLVLHSTVFLQSGVPIEYFIGYHIGAETLFEMDIKNPQF